MKFKGTYTALITPFRSGEVDWAALERIVEMQAEAGVAGVVPCGTTGESPTLSEREHEEVIECVVKTVRKRGLKTRTPGDGLETRPTLDEGDSGGAKQSFAVRTEGRPGGEGSDAGGAKQSFAVRLDSRAAKAAGRGDGDVGRMQVIAGVGTNSTERTVRKARQAAEAGADAVMVVSPYYNRPTQEGLFRHFEAVARATPLPVMLYNIPGRTGVEISIETIVRMRRACPTVAAVKHATGSVEGAAELMSRCDITVLSGDDPITWPLMSLGASGVVSVLSNLAPRAVKRLTDAALAGDMAAAREAHRAVYSAGKALLSLATNPIPIKTAMAMRGWCAEEFRLPLCGMDEAGRGRVGEAVGGLGE